MHFSSSNYCSRREEGRQAGRIAQVAIAAASIHFVAALTLSIGDSLERVIGLIKFEGKDTYRADVVIVTTVVDALLHGIFVFGDCLSKNVVGDRKWLLRRVVHFQWITSPLRDLDAFKPGPVAETRRQI